MKKLILYLLILVSTSCQSGTTPQGEGTKPPSHDIWDGLLKKHVNSAGMVDYEAFLRDKQQLEEYLNELSESPPDPERWSEAEQLAYWINAYNAFTVKLIIDNYPIESIEELHPTINIPMVNTVWHKKFFKIGNKESSLDEIEHEILRKQFDEPRIHFAIVCASMSCPALRREAFTAEKLDNQLEDQAKQFINDSTRNKITAEEAQLSKIFRWFEEDFTKNGTLVEYINKYADTPIKADTRITYLEYDWKLNDSKQ